METDSALFSKEELLAGLPARRARLLLFTIESRTAQLVAQSQHDAALYLTQAAGREPERLFYEALAHGRQTAPSPTIQDIERYTSGWEILLPAIPDDKLNAALTHLLGQKYHFTRSSVPRLRSALRLDQPGVQAAYQRYYDLPLDTIYAPEARPGERLLWFWSALSERLESLPPFWLAFALTLPVGPGLLAVPIALAGIGPLAGVALLVIFGLVNMLTVAALAEVVSRSAITRFGLGYLGQLVADYLGNAGSLFLSVVLGANNFLILIVFYLGIAGTLQGATMLPSELWIGVLFLVGLYFLTRKSLNTTVASTLLVVVINVALLLIIPLLALPRVQAANLTYANLPFLNGQPFDPDLLRLILGVMLTNYFAHLLVANYGRVVLRRDPSARSWMWGSVAAIGATILISCLWVLLVNGAIDPVTLSGETGTALAPLAELAGPSVNWLGSLLVILGLGIATIHISLGNFYLIQERLPAGFPPKARLLASILPLAGVFLLAEWFAISGSSSFTGLLNFVGVVALPLLGGVFPVLLLASSRRKGDFVPGLILHALGSRAVLAGLYLLFLSSLLLYGLFIWETWFARAATLLVGVLVFAATLLMLRRGAMRPRLVVEVRQDLSDAGSSLFAVTGQGKALPVEVHMQFQEGLIETQAATGEIPHFASLKAISFRLPAGAAQELKVWAHQLSAEGESSPLDVALQIGDGEQVHRLNLGGSNRQALLPLNGRPAQLTVILDANGVSEG